MNRNQGNKYSENPKKSPNNKRTMLSSLSDACGGGGVRYSTVKEKARPTVSVSVIIGALIVTALFMLIIFSLVEVSELSADISDMKGEIKTLAGDAKTLEGQLDYRYNKSKIDSVSEELGLGAGKNTTYYFASEDSSDVSEVIEPESELGTTIDSLLSAIGKNFRKVIDFLN